MCKEFFKHDDIKSTIYALALAYALLPDTSHKSSDGPTIPEKLKADVFKKLRYHVITGKLIAFVADVHAAFLASGLSYRPNARDLCGNHISGAPRRRRDDNLTHWLISTRPATTPAPAVRSDPRPLSRAKSDALPSFLNATRTGANTARQYRV